MKPLNRSARVGFIGLGNLGLPMALTLLRDGWELAVFDKVEQRAAVCAAEGAIVVGSVDRLADCDAVCLAVPDDQVATELLTRDAGGLLGLLHPGALVVLHSTLLPRSVVRLYELGAERDVQVLDAPVSGGPERAARGDLTIMVGGSRAALDRARPLLRAVGSQVLEVGPPGAGAAVKLANQLMMFAALAGAQEGLELAAAHGVQEEDVLAAVRSSLGDSWVARNWGFFDDMAAGYDRAGTPLRERSWSKDLWDVVATAREVDVHLPVAGLLAQHLADRVEAHARRTRGDGKSIPPHEGV